jgi:hypothetical protein
MEEKEKEREKELVSGNGWISDDSSFYGEL